MVRFKVVLLVAAAALMASTAAEAGGYRRGGPSMTPYGPVQNYTNTPEYKLWASNPAAYEQLMYQRQMQYEAQQQQLYLKMQQQYLKQMQNDPNFRAQMTAPPQVTHRRKAHKKHHAPVTQAPKDAKATSTPESKDSKLEDTKAEAAKPATASPESTKPATTP